MRRQGMLVLVLLVALAGCHGIGGGDDARASATSSITPAPVPTTAAGPGTALAPGLTDQGVTDAIALAAAHVDALRNRSYAVSYNRTVVTTNGTVRTQQVVRGVVGVHNERYRLTVDRSGTRANDSRTVYSYDGRRVIRERTAGNVTTRRIVMDGRGIGAAPADPVDVLPFDPRFSVRRYRLQYDTRRNGHRVTVVERLRITNASAAPARAVSTATARTDR